MTKEHAEYMRMWYRKNKDKVNTWNKKWQDTHQEQVKKTKLNWWRKHANQYVKFKGKQIYVRCEARSGVCSVCKRDANKNEIKYTTLHHKQYDEINPLAHTIELCVSCHRKQHKIIRNKKGQFVGVEL